MPQQELPVRSLTDRRQPMRSDHRRSAILEALDRQLTTTGFGDINIADVASMAGVTRSAFYFYFQNKAAAVAALLEPMYHDGFMAGDILTDTERCPTDRIRAMTEALLQTVEQHHYRMRAMLDARANSPAVRELWEHARGSFIPGVAGMIAAERTAEHAPPGPDPEVLATLLLEFNDRMIERFTLGDALTREQFAQGIETIWLRTIYGTTTDIDHVRTTP